MSYSESMSAQNEAQKRVKKYTRPEEKQPNFATILPIGSKVRSKLKAQLEPRLSHGGVPSLGKRKTARPFSPNAPMHLVLKAKRAKGLWSLLHRKNKAQVNSMIYVYAARFKVRVYRASVVGNQIHLLVKAHERKHLADFLRVLAGRIAVTISGARKHVKKIGRFWDYLYWSRLVNWGNEFSRVRNYLSEVLKENLLPKSTKPSERPEEWNQEAPEIEI